MTPGPMIFEGPIREPMRGPNGLHRAHRNKTLKTFFFGDHLNLDKKKSFNFGKDLFLFFIFWRSFENPEKGVPFSFPVLDCTKPEMCNI